MDTTTLILAGALGALFLLSGVFSGSETALFSLDRFHIKRFERSKSRRERIAARLVKHPESLLAGILLGNTLVNVASSSVTLSLFRRAIPGLGNNELVILATMFCTTMILVLGEILPKGIAVQAPEATSKIQVIFLNPLLTLLKPFSESLAWVAKRVLKLMGLKPDAVAVSISRRELQVIFEDMTQDEGLTEEEGEIASNIFSFSETRAEEIMTPRVDVQAVSVEEAVESLKEAVIRCRHARIPVYRDTLDQIVGVINAKDVLLDPDRPLDHFLRPVPFIPERARLSTILNEVKTRRLSLLVVVNEFGGTAGIVTKEDLVEEVVGEIFDEQERDEEPELRSIGEKSWRVNGLLSLEDLCTEMEVRLKSPAQTVAGHVAHLLGRPPRQGDRTRDGEVEFKVLSVKRHRASQVQVNLR